ncbi:MAG: cyclase family protein [Oscillibacter sp.]|nr:cyclase family protein [uncultured Oscillibacter sp.]MCI8971660.1 cyclase family protein [Oscillibacter sp.]
MLIDMTHTITPEIPVYPGTPVPSLSPACTFTRDGFRETLLTFSSHTGTHMDAPAHLFQEGRTLDQMPMSQFSGRATVLDVSQEGPVITEAFLRSNYEAIHCADYILFYTGWEDHWGTERFLEDTFPVPDEEAARYLVSRGLKGVGTDAISIDRMGDSHLPIHHILLKDSILSIENLCLKKVRGRKDFLFFALPMKFQDTDGAPVRAFAELREAFEGERRRR